MTDTYSARDAARILGRSERLVRKLATEGRLETVSTGPLRLSQESVHRERNARKAPPPPPEQPAGLDSEQIAAIVRTAVAEAVAEIVPRMLESRDASEARLVAELADARQQLEQLRQELESRQEPQSPSESAGIRISLPPLGWPFRR